MLHVCDTAVPPHLHELSLSASPTPEADTTRTTDRASDLLNIPVIGGFTADVVADEGPGRWSFRARTATNLSEVHLYVVHGAIDHLAADIPRMRRMKHPNVGRILFDAPLESDRTLVVTPPAAGKSLAEQLSTGGIDLGDLIRVLSNVCDALDAFHQQGRIFGHLTPEHVILRSSADGRYEAMVLPAWWLWRHGVQLHEAAPWGAPDKNVDFPTIADDAWALGALAWHALVGSPPSRDPSELQEHCERALPDVLVTLVTQLLRPFAVDRPTDFSGMMAALADLDESFNGGPGRIAPPMLMHTPIPIGDQLRAPQSLLSAPPPPPTSPMPDPSAGVLQVRPERILTSTPVFSPSPEILTVRLSADSHVDEVPTLHDSGPYPLDEVIDPTTRGGMRPIDDPSAKTPIWVWVSIGAGLTAAALTLAAYLLLA
ncbi:MAG: hypothetical protein ACI9MC_003082 [Kiritimatiellia bacterium]|jgi:hypothetical protein